MALSLRLISKSPAVCAASTAISTPRRRAIAPIFSTGTRMPKTLEPWVQTIRRVFGRIRCSKFQTVFSSLGQVSATL